MKNHLTAIDLFAGAGGFSLAAKELKINVLAAVELDKHASYTFEKNLISKESPTKLLNTDINEINIAELKRDLNLKKGELDILLGGPPCQGFSSHRILNQGVNDPRNQLLIKYFDFVKEFQPKAFLVENVPGLLWERHEEFLARFLKLAKSNGYTVIDNQPIIINAKDYGVPQNRRRAFILAFRNDINSNDIVWPPIPTHRAPSSKKPPFWPNASIVFEKPPKDVIEKLTHRYVTTMGWDNDKASSYVKSLSFGEPIKASDPCKVNMTHTDAVTQRFSQTPINGSREDIDFRLKCHENYKGHKDVYGRIIFHLPSNTVTTGCNNPSKGRFVHPWLNHGITLRHAARLQSFPDSFIFTGNTTEQARQIGNAVPFLLGTTLINSIKMQLESTSALKIAV